MIEGLISSFSSGFPAGDQPNNSRSVFRAFRTTPTRVLLRSCLLPVLPKSGLSATGSVGSQVRSYTSVGCVFDEQWIAAPASVTTTPVVGLVYSARIACIRVWFLATASGKSAST